MLYFRAFMFYYVDKFPDQADGVRSVFVDHSIHGWNELLHVYKEQLSFPKWAGDNLHAFYDVMTQLYYWVPEEEIRICHNGVPALDDDMIGYLDFLNLIDVVWEKFTEAADKCRRYAELCPKAFIFNNDKPWYDYKPKNFNVYFRKEDEPFIKDILTQYSRDYRKCIHIEESGGFYLDRKDDIECDSYDEENFLNFLFR